MKNYDTLHLDQDEQVLFEVRRHWIVFLGNVISFIFLCALPIIGYTLAERFAPTIFQFIFSPAYFDFFLLFYVVWFLCVWIGFFLSWTKYFLDVWYVTGSRIIDIEQQKIFYRSISNLRFDKIQDITIDVRGFIATFLNYGDIRVQTASEDNADFFMASVKDPENVKRIIFAQHNFVGNQTDRSPSNTV